MNQRTRVRRKAISQATIRKQRCSKTVTKTIYVCATLLVMIFAAGAYERRAFGADLVLSLGGRVTVEFVSSTSEFSNTLLVIPDRPAIIANLWEEVNDTTTGNVVDCENPPQKPPQKPCTERPATSCDSDEILEPELERRGGLRLFNAKKSHKGCKVDLDHPVPHIVNRGQTIVNSFPPNTSFQFVLCVQATASPGCTYKWSSNRANNDPKDGKDHVLITETIPGREYRLAWEDSPDVANGDFKDLIAVVRVLSNFRGAIDASTAIPIDKGRMLVGHDEINAIRLYNRAAGDDPIKASCDPPNIDPTEKGCNFSVQLDARNNDNTKDKEVD